MSRKPRNRGADSANRHNNRRDGLFASYSERREAIRQRLADFRAVPPAGYFYELAYCLMTPQSKAAHAYAVVGLLRACRFMESPFDAQNLLRTKAHYIRFHRTKARHLLAAHAQMQEISNTLSSKNDALSLREWLVSNVNGLGMKEATHFLRNIGRNDGLAILDRHILRNLVRYGAIRRIPTSLTRKKYLQVERKFVEFSHKVGIPLDELDLLFWSMETGEIRK